MSPSARAPGEHSILRFRDAVLESWRNTQRGQYTAHSAQPALDHAARLAHDQRHQQPGRAYRHALSPQLERAMKEALREGGQVMLLLNRRGFSTHVHCPSCGHVEACRFCDLALTYHRERDVLLCHYCGYEQSPPSKCIKCGQEQIRYQGLGTEKLQAEIEAKFPGMVVRRMDSDTMRKPGSHRQVLTAFREGLIHILLGTQMIAKGLDFPNVTLVGVARLTWCCNSTSPAERIFQLVVSRRPDRECAKRRRGIFKLSILSTWYRAGNDARLPVNVKDEFVHRREHNYPLFHRLAGLLCVHRPSGSVISRISAAIAARQTGEPVLAVGDEAVVRSACFRPGGIPPIPFPMQSPSAVRRHRLLRVLHRAAPSGSIT